MAEDIIIENEVSNKESPDNSSVLSVSNISGLEGLPHHLLETMMTNIGVSVAELSRKHVVLLVFLRYFGCVFCQRSIVDIVNSLTSLIKLNCIPIFVHQETVEEADEFFSSVGMPKPLTKKQIQEPNEKAQEPNNDQITKRANLMKKFLRVADPEGDYYYKQFGVKTSNAGDMTNNMKVVFETVKLSLTGGFKLTNSIADRASRSQLSATFVVANGKIINQHLNDKVYLVPDFLEVLLDIDGKGSDDLFDLLKDPSEQSTDTTTSTLSQTQDVSSTMVEFSKAAEEIKPLYQPTIKTDKKKKSNSCFSAQIEEISNQDIMQQYPLQQILNNKNQRKVLKLFSAKILAEESLMFWEEAKAYQKVQNETKRKALAKRIIDAYLNPKSLTEINTSSTVREIVLNRYKNEGSVIHLFDELVKNVESDSLMDVYVRFLDSDLFQQRISKK